MSAKIARAPRAQGRCAQLFCWGAWANVACASSLEKSNVASPLVYGHDQTTIYTEPGWPLRAVLTSDFMTCTNNRYRCRASTRANALWEYTC